MPHKRLRILRTVALCLAGAVTLAISSATLTFAQPKDMTLEHVKGSNQELVNMLQQTDPTTFLGYKDIIITQEQFDEIGVKAKEVVQGINSEYDKVVAIQKWVTNHIAYDYDNTATNQNAYTAFTEKKGICQAYSNLTKAMLSNVGIPCILVNGDSSAGGHAWNMAYVDNNWIFIDSTWGSVYTDIEKFSQDHKPYFCDSLQEVEGDFVFTYFNGVAVCDYRGSQTDWQIPDSFRGVPTTALSTKLSNYANADKVKSISFPASLKNIDNISYAFQRFTGLEKFEVAEGNPSFSAVSGALFDQKVTQLLVYPTASTQTSFQVPDTVTTLGECVFKYNAHLKHVLIPASVTSLDKDLFYDNSVTVYAPAGSAAAQYAQQNGLTLKDPSQFPSQKPEHTHTLTAVAAVASTCTQQGNIAHWYCKDCGKFFSDPEGKTEITKEQTELPLAEHTKEPIPGKQATCTTDGLSEGTKCSVCGQVLVEQKVIPAKGHSSEILPGKEATCTSEGLTEGAKCLVCGEVLVEQKVISAKGHTEEPIPGKQATCTTDGLTDGVKCSVCGEVLVEQEVIPAKGHTEEPIPGKQATCTTDGLTDGVKCSVCDEVLVKQEIIPAKGHSTEILPGKQATCTSEGLTEGAKCLVCGEVLVKQEVIPAKGHSYDNGVCIVCGVKDPNYVKPSDPAQPSQDVVLENKSGVDISMGNGAQAFDQGTVVVVNAITGGETYKRAQNALKDVAYTDKITVLDISAKYQGESAQPKVPVKMVFDIPDHLSSNGLKLFYVDTDGQWEEIPITVNDRDRTATASLSHFSTYVLANASADQNVPRTGDSQAIFLYATTAVLCAGLMVRLQMARHHQK